MTKTQNDSSVATAETENLKKVKDQLVLDIEEAKKIAEHLAERKKEKSALLSVNDELKSLKQKAMDEEKQKSLEIGRIPNITTETGDYLKIFRTFPDLSAAPCTVVFFYLFNFKMKVFPNLSHLQYKL